MENKTVSAFSLGAELRDCLVRAPGIEGVVSDVYPIEGVNEAIPYISYRCKGMSEVQTKDIGQGPCRAIYEIMIFDTDYDRGVALLEAARVALLKLRIPTVRGIALTNRSEGACPDCFYQSLEVTVRI